MGSTQVVQGIDCLAADADLKMAVVAGGVAGGADIADDLPLRDSLPLRNSDAGHVTVQRLVAVAVVDLHIVSVG